MKKFIVMLRVIKEAIKMASGRGKCIRCGKVSHQLDETLMDEPMALMIIHFFLQETLQVLPFRKDFAIWDLAITGILQDMINIMINMIFILVLLDYVRKDRQDSSLIDFSVLTRHG